MVTGTSAFVTEAYRAADDEDVWRLTSTSASTGTSQPLGNRVEQRPCDHGRFISSPETRICTATAGCWHLQPTLPHDHHLPRPSTGQQTLFILRSSAPSSVVRTVDRLRARQFGVGIPSRVTDLSILQNVRTGSGDHPGPCPTFAWVRSWPLTCT